ncbi:MAG: hypothetical protein KBB39_17315 [Phycicoccus sp.]|nr:hypothetical protein [Phycicoccus sp.]
MTLLRFAPTLVLATFGWLMSLTAEAAQPDTAALALPAYEGQRHTDPQIHAEPERSPPLRAFLNSTTTQTATCVAAS